MIQRVLAGAALLALYSGAAQLDPLVARSRGRLNAPVTVYEMSDFQCPYCRAFALATLPLLERDYVASGKVRFVFINLPLPSLHANATAAAEAAMCAARQSRFWPMHDLLFRHQDDWAKLADPRPMLLALGDSAGADHAPLAACLPAPATPAQGQAAAGRAPRAGTVSPPPVYIGGGLPYGNAPGK